MHNTCMLIIYFLKFLLFQAICSIFIHGVERFFQLMEKDALLLHAFHALQNNSYD